MRARRCLVLLLSAFPLVGSSPCQEAPVWISRIVAVALVLFASRYLHGQGQLGPYGDTTSTPIAGAGHNYVINLGETVDPMTGGLSVRLGAPVPAERALNLPQYAYTYDSNGQFGLTPNWAYSSFTHSQYVSGVNLNNNLTLYKPNSVSFSTYVANTTAGTGFSITCTYWSDFIYTDPDGGRHPLLGFTGISNSDAQLGCPAIGINATTSDQSVTTGIYTGIFTGSGTSVAIFDNHGNLFAATDSSAPPSEDTNGNFPNSTGRYYGNTSAQITLTCPQNPHGWSYEFISSPKLWQSRKR